MWIFTRQGFFSAVHDDYCNEGEIMVRARIIDDLERLLEKTGIEADILVIRNADYRFMVKLSVEQWTDYVAGEAASIDYPNFKNAIIAKSEHERASAYMRCWEAMYQFQEANAQSNHWVDE